MFTKLQEFLTPLLEWFQVFIESKGGIGQIIVNIYESLNIYEIAGVILFFALLEKISKWILRIILLLVAVVLIYTEVIPLFAGVC